MTSHRAFFLGSVALVVFATGCKDKPEAAQTSTTSASADAPAAPREGAAAPVAKETSVADFASRAPAVACKTISACKNDKVKVVMGTTAMMVVGLGTLDKPELAKDVRPIDTALKSEKRATLTEAECGAVGSTLMKVVGLDAEALAPRLGKTVAYDASKASACLAALAQPPAACAETVTIAQSPKFSEIGAMEKDVKGSLEAFAKPCDGVFAGLVEDGGACEADIECKGKAKCRDASTAKTKPGSKGAAKAKPAAAGKTCQASR